MATEVILPMLGETMNEGTIVGWSKNEGDAVKPGDVLYTVESDKATLEVEATTPGFLRRILAPAGSTVAVLSVVAYITATPDEVVSVPAAQVAPVPRPSGAAPSKTSDSRSPAGAIASLPPVPAGRLLASPRARRAARERGLDLTRVVGSGPAGRIVERDLNTVAATPRLTPLATRMAADLKVNLSGVVGTGPGGRITTSDLEAATRAAPATALEPLSRTQRIMADRMTASFTSAPHFYLHAEVNARRLLALREELTSRPGGGERPAPDDHRPAGHGLRPRAAASPARHGTVHARGAAPCIWGPHRGRHRHAEWPGRPGDPRRRPALPRRPRPAPIRVDPARPRRQVTSAGLRWRRVHPEQLGRLPRSTRSTPSSTPPGDHPGRRANRRARHSPRTASWRWSRQ